MGRYRPFTAALVLHCNVLNKVIGQKNVIADGISLNPQDWQIMEAVIEHKEEYWSMVEIARSLGIPQSTFSRAVKSLQDYNLIEKYKASTNKKSIILRPTEYALKIYAEQMKSQDSVIKRFETFFKDLDSISDEDLKTFTDALNSFTQNLASYSNNMELVKME